LKKSDKRSGKLLEKSPEYLKVGEAGWMLIRPNYLVSSDPRPLAKVEPQATRALPKKRPVDIPNDGYCVDTYDQCPQMARFAFFVSRECNMIGKITEINPTGKKYDKFN